MSIERDLKARLGRADWSRRGIIAFSRQTRANDACNQACFEVGILDPGSPADDRAG